MNYLSNLHKEGWKWKFCEILALRSSRLLIKDIKLREKSHYLLSVERDRSCHVLSLLMGGGIRKWGSRNKEYIAAL